jgi:hypothetical protein
MNSEHIDLSFVDKSLHDVGVGGLSAYMRPWWLNSDFGSEIWNCEFCRDAKLRLCWNVPLGKSGHSLISHRCAHLLTLLKAWVVTATHPHFSGGRVVSPISEYHYVNYCVDWIDYFLLRFDRLEIGFDGLSTLSSNDLLSAIAEIASSPKKSETIYEWRNRVSILLKDIAAGLSNECFDSNFKSLPSALWRSIPEAERCLTDLADLDIIKARIVLWLRGEYRRGYVDGYAWGVSSLRLSKVAVASSIRLDLRLPPVVELGVRPIEQVGLELEPVPVRDKSDQAIGELRLKGYVRALRSLAVLKHFGLETPMCLPELVSAPLPIGIADAKRVGRYRSIPPEIVFSALKDAIEFWLTNATGLMRVFVNICRVSSRSGSFPANVTSKFGIEKFAEVLPLNMRVDSWALSGAVVGPSSQLTSKEYFCALRSNRGLWELFRVLFGCAQLICGSLIARRAGELVELKASECLDDSGKYIAFKNRKSGALGHRETEKRPVPNIVARVISDIANFQQQIEGMGFSSRGWKLFSYPAMFSGRVLEQCSQSSFRESFDYFCDYFEIPGSASGNRYYFRQHQLRRFFAMVFFWSNSFGGVDTLRYFLGHTDLAHVYRYITDNTPGAMLRGVKAEWASKAVLESQAGANGLGQYVQETFGVNDFHLLEEGELSDYIEILMERHKVSIEPEFLDMGRRFRILVKVSEV